jgi:hypothetical protein
VIVHSGRQQATFLFDEIQAKTDNSGHFLLQGLSAESVYVWAVPPAGSFPTFYPNVQDPNCCFPPNGAQQVNLAGGQHLSGIDFTLQNGAYATGRVYDADTGGVIAGLPINLVAPDLTTYGNVYVDASGNYTSLTVPTGSYYLMAFLRNGNTVYYPNYVCSTNCDLSQAHLFDFSAAQAYPIDFPISHLERVFAAGFEP